DRPTLAAHAQLASFIAAGATIDQPDVTFTLAPIGEAYRGRAEMQGRYSGQNLTANADIGVENAALALDNLTAHVAAIEAQGSARFSARGAEAQLALSGRLDGLAEGVSGRVLGHAQLTPQMISLDAQIADAHAGLMRVRAAHVAATGPYRAIE